MAWHREKWQSSIEFLCVPCDVSLLMAVDGAQEACVACQALGTCTLCKADWAATNSLRRRRSRADKPLIEISDAILAGGRFGRAGPEVLPLYCINPFRAS